MSVLHFPAAGGGFIQLTFDLAHADVEAARHVLVFPNYNHRLVMVRHQSRGLELPGGKVERGEQPMAAAVREVYEESGAVLKELRWIGQYSLRSKRFQLTKNIYYGEVLRLEPLPEGFETVQVVLFDRPPYPVNNKEFSCILQDRVYPLSLQYIAEHFESRWSLPEPVAETE